jgi:hypothetical protein
MNQAVKKDEHAELKQLMASMNHQLQRSLGKAPRYPAPTSDVQTWHKSMRTAVSSSLMRASLLQLQSVTQTLTSLRVVADAQAAGSNKAAFERMLNPKCRLPTSAEEITPWSDHDGMSPNTLFVAQDNEEEYEDTSAPEEPFLTILAANHYCSTIADLIFESPNHSAIIQSVIDSGAAQCAIDAKVLREKFPDVQVHRTDRHFTDASNKRMNVCGYCTLCFRLGDLRLCARVYVFRNLGAKLLLGVNAISGHHLGISTRKQQLYSEADGATAASFAPIKTEQTVRTPGMQCIQCEQPTPLGDTCSATQCHCAPTQPSRSIELHCNKSDECLLALDDTGATVARQKCRPLIPTRPSALIEKSNAYQSILRTGQSVKVKPGKTQTIRLAYDDLCPGDPKTIEVQLTEEFKALCEHHGVEYVEKSLHSSLNLHAAVRISHCGSSPMTVPGKMAVAVAITKGDNNTSRIHSVSQESETPTTDEANHTPTGALPLQLELDERANPLIWRKHGTAPPSYSITCLDGTFDVGNK